MLAISLWNSLSRETAELHLLSVSKTAWTKDKEKKNHNCTVLHLQRAEKMVFCKPLPPLILMPPYFAELSVDGK